MLVDIVPYLAERQALCIEMQDFGYDLLWMCHVLKSIMLYEPSLAAIAEILLLDHILFPPLLCFDNIIATTDISSSSLPDNTVLVAHTIYISRKSRKYPGRFIFLSVENESYTKKDSELSLAL